MLTSLLFLAATSTTPSPITPLPRPDQPAYNAAKAFVAIVKRDAEVNVQDLSYAFGMSELLGQGFTWGGPSDAASLPRFFAYYDPPKSPIGISKIVIFWDNSSYALAERKPGIALQLKVIFRPEACPKEAELAQATGVAMEQTMVPDLHGGPLYSVKWFSLLNDKNQQRRIDYNPVVCELSASFIRER